MECVSRIHFREKIASAQADVSCRTGTMMQEDLEKVGYWFAGRSRTNIGSCATLGFEEAGSLRYTIQKEVNFGLNRDELP